MTTVKDNIEQLLCIACLPRLRPTEGCALLCVIHFIFCFIFFHTFIWKVSLSLLSLSTHLSRQSLVHYLQPQVSLCVVCGGGGFLCSCWAAEEWLEGRDCPEVGAESLQGREHVAGTAWLHCVCAGRFTFPPEWFEYWLGSHLNGNNSGALSFVSPWKRPLPFSDWGPKHESGLGLHLSIPIGRDAALTSSR